MRQSVGVLELNGDKIWRLLRWAAVAAVVVGDIPLLGVRIVQKNRHCGRSHPALIRVLLMRRFAGACVGWPTGHIDPRRILGNHLLLRQSLSRIH